jgi:hypothetical protein
MSHPSGSNRRPTVYKTVALPAELGWQDIKQPRLGRLRLFQIYYMVFYSLWQEPALLGQSQEILA